MAEASREDDMIEVVAIMFFSYALFVFTHPFKQKGDSFTESLALFQEPSD